MRTVAIGTASHLLRIPQAGVFPVVTLEIRFRSNVGNLITGHHFGVGMAFQASLGMESPSLCNIIDSTDRMLSVAVDTGGSISVSVCEGLVMHRFEVGRFSLVALTAKPCSGHFIIFDGGDGMNVGMAFPAGDRQADRVMNAACMFLHDGCVATVAIR